MLITIVIKARHWNLY